MLIGEAKNMLLILVDGGCGDENPFFNAEPELNLIEVHSWVTKKEFSKLIKSSWFTDSQTTLQGRFWWQQHHHRSKH